MLASAWPWELGVKVSVMEEMLQRVNLGSESLSNLPRTQLASGRAETQNKIGIW